MRDTDSKDTATTDLSIGEAAELLGITTRTLRHWDSIGLLSPSWRTVAGHRLYTEGDIERAQQILVYREVGLPLAEVQSLVDGTDDVRGHLLRQRRLLRERASHLRHMIGAVDQLLEAIDMEKKMDAREAAELFGDGWRQDWADEAQQRWGDTPEYAESERRNSSRSKADWERMYAHHDTIVAKLAAAVAAGENPNSELGREISALHRESIAEHYPCSRARQVCLARMYTVDTRFAQAYESEEKGGVPGATAWLLKAVEADARAHGIDPETASWND